jgi:beta-N-acetylhexosaminidase
MTSFHGELPPPQVVRRVRDGDVGGVVLFGDNIASADQVARLSGLLQDAARGGGNPQLLIAVDQEGGDVRRIPFAPPAASAAAMDASGGAQEAARESRLAGRSLRAIGVNVDLAPVADVESSRTSFLGERSFSGDRLRAARDVSAFIDGLQAHGVAATAKHFPGLGTASASTDAVDVRVRTPRAELLRRLLPFRAAIAHHVSLIMVSNARYPTLDPTALPAVASATLVGGLLRTQLHYTGVVISDTMEAPGPRRLPRAPARAIAAGTDVLLYRHDRAAARGAAELQASFRTGKLACASLLAANARIRSLKEQLDPPRRSPTR